MEPADGIVEFFGGLGQREHEPLLGKVRGPGALQPGGGFSSRSVAGFRGQGQHHGAAQGGPADCTVGADRALSERSCRGEENALAAVLRGALVCSGDVELLFAIQRIFPGPPQRRLQRSVRGSR
jgi:hypothetical protein